MNEKISYKVVDDKMRSVDRGSKCRDAISEMQSGKTIFVPITESNGASVYYNAARCNTINGNPSNAAKRIGMRLRTRSSEVDGMKGLVMWLEPIEPSTG